MKVTLLPGGKIVKHKEPLTLTDRYNQLVKASDLVEECEQCGQNVNNFPSDEDIKGMARQWNCDKIIEILDNAEGVCQDEFDELKDFLIKVKRGDI